MPRDDEIDWAKVQLQVRAGDMTRNQICAAHHITPRRLANRIRENKWDVAEDVTDDDRKTIFEQLFWALERQITHLVGLPMSGNGEREVAALSKLVTTLDKLMSLETRVTGRKPQQRQSKEMTALRAKIAKRLDELKLS